MERWKQDFIEGLRQGKPAESCARMYAGLPLYKVHEARDSDEEFAQEWDEASEQLSIAASLTSRRTLSPGALEALLFAQCNDATTAAYFGLKEEEFHAAIENDAGLKRVYETARPGGLAALQQAQYEAAIGGDRSMLTFLGKQYLGQADKVEHNGALTDNSAPKNVTINNIILRNMTNDQLEAMMEQAQGIGQQLVIEGQVEEII